MAERREGSYFLTKNNGIILLINPGKGRGFLRINADGRQQIVSRFYAGSKDIGHMTGFLGR